MSYKDDQKAARQALKKQRLVSFGTTNELSIKELKRAHPGLRHDIIKAFKRTGWKKSKEWMDAEIKRITEQEKLRKKLKFPKVTKKRALNA